MIMEELMHNKKSVGEILFKVFMILWILAMVVILISALGSIFIW